ncbi:ABC transporter permease [Dietzia sp.]|uniref:ABC transporter permease n=1 Tax=Dietzia sp. TaxID=1871616 RepID=UPI002FD8CEB8
MALVDGNSTMVNIGLPLGIGIVVLAVVAVLVNRWGSTGHARDAGIASVRAALQLAALAGVLTLVIDRLWATVLFLVLMSAVAAWTSASRIAKRRPAWSVVATCWVPVALPTFVVLAGLAALGALPLDGFALIPSAGIMLGNAMTTTTLAGRRCLEELVARRGEVEAALSLGFDDVEARTEICREASATALLPAIDQTKSVGIVVIPGAFVGMVLGGASVVDAAIMQLYVMISILAVGAVATVLTSGLAARGRFEAKDTSTSTSASKAASKATSAAKSAPAGRR